MSHRMDSKALLVGLIPVVLSTLHAQTVASACSLESPLRYLQTFDGPSVVLTTELVRVEAPVFHRIRHFSDVQL